MRRFFLSLLLVACAVVLAGSPAVYAWATEADTDSDVTAVDSAAEENVAEGAQHNPVRAGADVASPFDNLQYKVMYWQGEWVVTIRGVISEDLQLPATVEINVPAGAPVFWVGEVYAGFGAQPFGSGEIAPPYNVYPDGDYDIYTVVLNTTHAVQIEFPFPGDPTVPSTEDHAIEFSYTPLSDVGELWLATAIPADAAVPDTAVRELEGLGPNGERSFARVFYDAVGGQEYTALIEYRTGVTETERNLDPWVVPVLIGSLALVAAAVFLLFRRTEK
ncbi:MAG: hypothetical protein FWE46_02670 [Coriobacteriia bacterium]|nr:hypothetical protein [Coriobacteriia bacterium]